jgi:hypothetical protein
MRIGELVRYIGASDEQVNFAGDDPRNVLIKWGYYRLKDMEVESWYTLITLSGFEELRFNSVCFEEAS